MSEDSILDAAKALVHGPRQDAYDHPVQNFQRTALIWEAILGHPVTAEQVGLCMVGVKLAREAFAHKRDNLVDMAGYCETVSLVASERSIGERFAKMQFKDDVDVVDLEGGPDAS